jgi:hypothetical protein
VEECFWLIDVCFEVISVDTNGVPFTAQAAGRQMERFVSRGSMILIASLSGTIPLKVRNGRMLRFPHPTCIGCNASLTPTI